MNRFSLSFWTLERRLDFYERAGLYLLYAFILSIASNPFIMLAVGLEKFSYVYVENTMPGYTQPLETLSSQQREYINKYALVDKSFIERQKEFENHMTWIIITALLGWCVTSPRFDRGWKKIIAKVRNDESF